MADAYLKAARHQRQLRHKNEATMGVSEEQVQEFRDAFQLFDTDGTGE